MAKVIYNEGRVVGLSSYEEYVRQLKSVDPNFDVCTEREWLASSLASGSSMILRVPSNSGTKVGTTMYMYQVSLPDNTHISTANNITGSYFYGDCEFDGRGWATVVKDYGSLISNTNTNSPQNSATTINTTTVPVGNIESELKIPDTKDMSTIQYTTQHRRLMNYVKVVDGIVIQPGTWSTSGKSSSPYKDFAPDLTKVPVIRLTFMEQITTEFYMLLTGFTNRSVIRGITKFDFGAVDTENSQDGDFLGPECYPWTSKIQFISAPAVDYLMRTSMKSGSRNLKIETYKDNPLIKITSNDLMNMYTYSRRSSISTGTNKNNFGDTITTWTGGNDASEWYNDTRDTNIVVESSDNNISTSGVENVVIYTPKNKYDNTTSVGITVQNRYESDDKNTIKNGIHGGWYDIRIDPYQMIKDFIDEVYARFKYIDRRFDEIEAEIKKEIDHRKDADSYVLKQVYGDNSLVTLLNQLLKLIYDETGLQLDVSYEKVNPEDYEGSDGVLYRPIIRWKDNNVPDTNKGKIPRAKLNVYSGEANPPSSAGSWIKSRSADSENDLYAK